MRSSQSHEQKNKFRSLHNSLQNSFLIEKGLLEETKSQQTFKPNFLYFTQRERQKINFFDCLDPQTKQTKIQQQNQADLKIQNALQRKFKIKTKYFDIKKLSIHRNNSLNSIKQNNFIHNRKSKTLKKQISIYKSEEPCVGMYDPKPENIMKRITRNQTFRKGKSCFQINLNKQNYEDSIEMKIELHQREKLNHLQKKSFQKRKLKKKAIFHSLINTSSLQNSVIEEKPSQNKIRIKCFDMSKQKPRQAFRTISNKAERSQFENDHIEKNFKRLIPKLVSFNENQIEGYYQMQKQKYQVKSYCGILKNIKLDDYIKMHLNEVAIDEQNAQ